MNTLVYKWMEEVQIVNGYNRSSLNDIPRSNHFLADTQIEELKSKIDGMPIQHKDLLTEAELGWLDLLIEKEVVITIPQAAFAHFPSLPQGFTSPSRISGAVIDNLVDLESILDLLTSLLCYHVHIRVPDELAMHTLLTTHFQTTNFQSVSFELAQLSTSKADLERILDGFMGVADVVVHGQEIATTMLNQDFTRIKAPDAVKADTFTPNFAISMEGFMESGAHNVFYNQKLYFFADGTIGLTDSKAQLIGDLRTTSTTALIAQLTHGDFPLWHSAKSKTDVCNQCEFRRMCSDKRVPIQRSDQTWFHTTECAYNPFISKWKGESGYQSLAACGVQSDAFGFTLDLAQLERVNTSLWAPLANA